MKKRSVICISLLLLLALSACQLKNDKHPEKGKSAADFTIHDLEGKTVMLSQFKGKVVMLNFWATWCPPCREEMPSMEALYRKFNKNPDFIMLAVSIDNDAETVREFVKKNNYTLPVFHDANKNAGSRYGITGVPDTFLIDRNGIIREKVIGPFDWMDPKVVSFIDGLLKEK